MKKVNVIKFVVFVLFLSGMLVCITYFDLASYLNPSKVRDMVQSNGLFAPLVFVGLYIIATIALIPGTPLTIAAGVLFGTILGTLYTVIGATIGAVIAFLIARLLGEEFVERLLKDKFKKLSDYNKKLEDNGIPVVLFLRFIPLFPFNALNFGLG